jgi:hypothetical protein
MAYLLEVGFGFGLSIFISIFILGVLSLVFLHFKNTYTVPECEKKPGKTPRKPGKKPNKRPVTVKTMKRTIPSSLS